VEGILEIANNPGAFSVGQGVTEHKPLYRAT
jgi:hypothetical protein